MIAFAGTDRATANELRKALEARGIDAFTDERIPPGQDIMQAINEAIDQSDYFVLLWSTSAVGNLYVQAEYTAAFMRGLTEKRPFLHIVRLDEAPPCSLLAAIKYLDARGDWGAIADQLSAAWQWDGPAPDSPNRAEPTINVEVYNEDLSVAYRIAVPARATAQELLAAARARLELKTQVSVFDGQVGARLFYRLEKDDRQLAANDSLAAVGITDGSRVNLRVRVEWFGLRVGSVSTEYRQVNLHRPSDDEVKRHLFREAFGHLPLLGQEDQSGSGSQPNP